MRFRPRLWLQDVQALVFGFASGVFFLWLGIIGWQKHPHLLILSLWHGVLGCGLIGLSLYSIGFLSIINVNTEQIVRSSLLRQEIIQWADVRRAEYKGSYLTLFDTEQRRFILPVYQFSLENQTFLFEQCKKHGLVDVDTAPHFC